jgi:diguanylate cyclase (GGDEF)-like protein/PAS domain S-box-containing protein
MNQPLSLLIVEDAKDDVDLLLNVVRDGGYDVAFEVVDAPAAMRAALKRQDWDVIASDHSMPHFSAPAALALAKKIRPEVPFIVVSGKIDLDSAVSLMKEGAQDYVQKHELARMAPAIARELRQRTTARERQRVKEALETSEMRYRRLFETAQDGILILDADTGQIADVNPFLMDMLGYSHQDFVGKKLWEIRAFVDKEASKADFKKLQDKGYVRYEDLPLEASDGRRVDVEFVSNVYLVDHTKVIQCNIRDITKRKQTEKSISAARDFYLTLFEEFPALIWRSGVDAKCDYFNKTWLTFTGRTIEQEMGDGWAEGVHPDDLDRCVSFYLDAFHDRRPFQMEYRMRRHDGEYRWIKDLGQPFNDQDGRFAGYFGSCYDITEQKNSEEHIRRLAHYDNLTGLPNRLLFYDRLGQAINLAERNRHELALLYLDLDEFKTVNDTLGHDAGDGILRSAAERIQQQVRESDTVARIGGDEFAVILHRTVSRQDAATVATKIIDALFASFQVSGRKQKEIRVGASIGIATFPTDARDVDVLVKVADSAMYKAKQIGNSYKFAEG